MTEVRPRVQGVRDWTPRPTLAVYPKAPDRTVCERAQLGVSSRSYQSGVYPRQDRLVFDFNERWRRAMGRPLVG